MKSSQGGAGKLLTWRGEESVRKEEERAKGGEGRWGGKGTEDAYLHMTYVLTFSAAPVTPTELPKSMFMFQNALKLTYSNV